MRILVTGANGFIGQALCPLAAKSGFLVRAAVRKHDKRCPPRCETVEVGDIGAATDWKKALSGVDVVVHLAGIAHSPSVNRLSELRNVNVLGTRRLALEASASGVKRFIFISSLKVNGEGRSLPYNEKDTPCPQDGYAMSKLEAEKELFHVSLSKTGFEVVVLRIPLVYGPGVRGNFRSLIGIVNSGIPLPLKNVKNRRSFIYIGNLLDAIMVSITHPAAAGEIFMVSDGEDVSTVELIETIASAMEKRVILFPLPYGVLKILSRVSGKGSEFQKLTGTFIVDSGKIKTMLGWKAQITLREGIKETFKATNEYKAYC